MIRVINDLLQNVCAYNQGWPQIFLLDEKRMKKKRIYLSLPISGFRLDARRYEAAQKKQEILDIYKDVDVVTPFEIVQEDGAEYSYCMGKCIEELLKCDAIYMMAGWVESNGCMAEFQVAKVYGIEVMGVGVGL